MRQPPYPQREVVATNGVVAACDARAADAGVEVLRQGGNAADAAVVTGFLMMVYEPFSCGLGGHGGHMAYYDAASNTAVGIDASTKAPLAAHAEMFADDLLEVPRFYGDIKRVKVANDANALGFRAMFAPSTVAQYHHVLSTYGTLPWDDAIAPALAVARDGFVADEIYTRRMNDALELLQRHGDDALTGPFQQTFFPDGAPLRPGATVRHPDMATTLALLAKEGPDAFYGGEVSARIVEWVERHGGILSEDDFTGYRVESGPLHVSRYRGYDVYGWLNCANGSTIAAILAILDRHDLRALGYGSPEALHTIIEAMKLAFLDRYAYVSDRDHVPVPYDGLVTASYARERSERIDPHRAQPFAPGDPWRHQGSGSRLFDRLGIDLSALTGGAPSAAADRDTTFMVAADADRNVMMITTSNFSNSKVVVPGLGFQLNNSMSGANPAPGHALSIAPGKRILRNSGPTLVFEDGYPVLALSAPGGRKIITGTVMSLINVLDYGLGLQAALDAPRLHCEAHDMRVTLEDGFPAATLERLATLGHDLEVTPTFEAAYGRMQAIRMDVHSRLYVGASEPRSHGGARGY
jgi:gamma-glutamyltranspeptidase / glutathione hydrolase